MNACNNHFQDSEKFKKKNYTNMLIYFEVQKNTMGFHVKKLHCSIMQESFTINKLTIYCCIL